MSFLSRFPGTSIDQDRSDARDTLQARMAAAHTSITATASDIEEAAWDNIIGETWPGLIEADCEAAEARADALTAALLVLRDGPPPLVTDAQRREIAQRLAESAACCDRLAAGTVQEIPGSEACAPGFIATAKANRAVAALLLHGLESRA